MDLRQILATLRSIAGRGIGVPIALVMILAMMVLPLPALALDVLFTFNITLSLIIILAVAVFLDAACIRLIILPVIRIERYAETPTGDLEPEASTPRRRRRRREPFVRPAG